MKQLKVMVTWLKTPKKCGCKFFLPYFSFSSFFFAKFNERFNNINFNRTPEEAQNIQPYKFDIEPQKATVPDPSLKPYDSDELDLLALFATIPKICYPLSIFIFL